MPTIKPRVQVTLEPHTHEVIERLAALQGRTRGAVIADLIDSVAPALARTVALLDAAASAPSQVKRGLRSVVDSMHADLAIAAGGSAAKPYWFDSSLGDTEEGSTPVSVTRGSGTDTTPLQKKTKTKRKGSNPGVSEQ